LKDHNINNNNFKEEEGITSLTSKKKEDIFEDRSTKKINLLSSEHIDYFIKNLSSPRFLGSIHIKQQTIRDSSLLENGINKNLNFELSRSLKSPLNNPITRFLIVLMIFFNVFWIIFILAL